MSSRVMLAVGLLLSSVSPLFAQNGVSGANVTIQLPNFTTFGVNTSVLVPDSGPSPYAAQRQSFYSRTMYGRMNPQRAFGAQRSAAIASVTAQVHDQRQADEAILRAARARRTNWVRGSSPQAARGPDAANPALLSVAEIERRRATGSTANDGEAQALVAKARQAEAAGKPKVAALYYEMAAKRAGGELKGEIDRASRDLRTAAREPASR